MLIIGNGRLVTRDAGQPFFENGAVAIDGTTIKKVGTLEEIKKEFPEAEFVDAKGGVIMPAFINTNVTLIFSAAQALLAARAGATYVSPFLGRLDDISMPGIDLIYDITEIFQMHNIETEIIAASVRNPIHVIDCAKAGADIATVPYKVLEQMTKHPLTDQGIAKFQADYKAVFGE